MGLLVEFRESGMTVLLLVPTPLPLPTSFPREARAVLSSDVGMIPAAGKLAGNPWVALLRCADLRGGPRRRENPPMGNTRRGGTRQLTRDCRTWLEAFGGSDSGNLLRTPSAPSTRSGLWGEGKKRVCLGGLLTRSWARLHIWLAIQLCSAPPSILPASLSSCVLFAFEDRAAFLHTFLVSKRSSPALCIHQ